MLEWVVCCARFGDVVIEVKDGAQTMDGLVGNVEAALFWVWFVGVMF